MSMGFQDDDELSALLNGTARQPETRKFQEANEGLGRINDRSETGGIPQLDQTGPSQDATLPPKPLPVPPEQTQRTLSSAQLSSVRQAPGYGQDLSTSVPILEPQVEDHYEPPQELWDDAPATEGFRGFLNRTLKMNLKPAEAELDERHRLVEAGQARYEGERRYTEDWKLINRDKSRTLGYCGFLSVISEKGGVGKTTISACLSYELGKHRQDPIVVADLNPDKGSLSSRMGISPTRSIRDLVNHIDEIENQQRSVHEFLSKVPGANVQVLAGDNNPLRRENTDITDVAYVARAFQPYFSIAVLDNGTGITHSALQGSLRVSHGMALVVDNTEDARPFIESTLTHLEEHPEYAELRKRVVVVVIEKIRRDDIEQWNREHPMETQLNYISGENIRDTFSGAVRDTVVIPYDPRLAVSGPIQFGKLAPTTRQAIMRLSAVLMDDLVH